MKNFLVLLISFALGVGAIEAQGSQYGRFLDDLRVRLLSDGRRVELLQKFRFEDPSLKIWTTPRGRVVDGASIPRALWSVVGGPLSGPYRNASVIHDHYCDVRTEDWRSTHRVFYYGMRAGGVPEVKARSMYAAVIAFGPRWGNVKVRFTERICSNGDCRDVAKERIDFIVVRLNMGPRDLRLLRDLLRRVESTPSVDLATLERWGIEMTDDRFPEGLRF